MSSKESNMSDQTRSIVNPSVDPYSYLGIVRNSDGSIRRLPAPFPNTPASSDPNRPSPILSKDIPINQSNNTSLRVFLPRIAHDSSSPTKLPLIVFFHGGGFIVGSAGSPMFHNFCTTMAVEIPAVVVSVEYRLAPEHRLPAAYDDGMEALHWIKSTNDGWFTGFADFSNCYLMGGSAGSNIAYHAGLRVAACVNDLEPLKIKGLLLHQPYFGGTTRTPSELRLVNDKVLPLCVNDFMWELGLPIGVDRDHEYCNPTVGGGSSLCGQIRQLGWKVLVTGCDGDPLMDRQIEFVKMMKEKGVQVAGKFDEGNCHGIEIFDPSKAKELCLVIKEFILS